MKHAISVLGFSYTLRPVEINDATFIVEIRTGHADRSQYIHAISQDVSLQEDWIKKYYERDGDYYFVIENILTGKREGLISIYDIDQCKKTAEWGRWIILPESLCAIESVYLMYKVAFEILGLESVYSRTIKDNIAVVSFHDSLGAMNKGVLIDEFEIDGKKFDAIKHLVYRETWEKSVLVKTEKIAKMIHDKVLKQEVTKMDFHHIGVATKDITTELVFWEMLGYVVEGEYFKDELQGIRGIFIVARNQPRLELLENLPTAHTLDRWLEKGVKFYHFAYLVEDIDAIISLYTKKFRGKVISPKKPSVAFGLRNICFIMFSNGLIIELIENNVV